MRGRLIYMNKGFIGKIILILIALAIFFYFFDWSIFDAIESEKGRATINYIKDIINISWDYIKALFVKIYEIF